jgi:RNA polymerase sigma-70 factor (ECF subfamily)
MSVTDPSIEARARFEAVCGVLRPDLYRFLLWLARDPSVAEEVVQETLLRAWRSFASLEASASAKAWLCTIARRELARRYERRQLEVVDIADLDQVEDPALGVEENPAVLELREALWKLEPEYRDPLVLQVLMGLSTEEIATQLGLTAGAVLTRLFRARQQLRTALAGGSESP